MRFLFSFCLFVHPVKKIRLKISKVRCLSTMVIIVNMDNHLMFWFEIYDKCLNK